MSLIFPGSSFGIPIFIVRVQSTGSFSTVLHDLLLWSFFHPDIRRFHRPLDNCQKLATRGILFSIRLMKLDRYLYHCIFSFDCLSLPVFIKGFPIGLPTDDPYHIVRHPCPQSPETTCGVSCLPSISNLKRPMQLSPIKSLLALFI